MMRLSFTGSMPLHTTTSSLWQSYDPMMRLCLTWSMPLHTTTHISMAAIWSHDEAMLYRKHALTYHQPHLYDSLMIQWWDYVLQEACPYIPQATSLWQPYDPMMRLCFTGSMPLHTTNHVFMAALWSHDKAMLYRKHALTYHQPHLYDSLMIQWWDYVLQEACPYIPQATSLWQPYDPMMRLCFIGSMPLHTTNLISMTVLWSNDETMFYRKHALTYHRPHLYGSLMILWWDYVLQEACPYIPQATSLWQPYDPMMRLCFTGSMPLHTTGHISMAALWSHDETMLYRKHALTYHQPHLYDSLMILWWDYVLQEACPYIPPTSSLWQSYDPMMRLCFTGSMPLHTTGHISMAALWSYDETMFYRKHALTYHRPHLYGSLMILWWGYVLQEACPYIPQATSLWQPYDPMMRLCFTGSMPLHTTNLISMTVLWSYDETMFYRKHALTYHQPHLYDSLMIQWWDYVLQEACPYIPQATSLWQPYDPMMRLCFTGSMPLHTTGHISMAALWSHDETMLYRKHALTYHQPHLYDSLMILWWDYVLQEACPYIPQTSSLWQSYDPMMRLCFTGSMPLHTTGHISMAALWSYDETMFYRKHALTYHRPHLYGSLMILWWGYVLQEACPYIPQATSLWQPYDPMMRLCFTGSMPLHTTNLISMTVLWTNDETMFYRKHALTYHRPHLYGSHMILWWGYVLQEACSYIPPTSSLWQSYDPMMRLCFTGSMPLHTTGHISMAALWSYDETMFYRKHALTYHRPHLYGSLMILWWGYVLQEACPYIPQATSLWQPYDPMMRLCFTGSMPLHTTNLISMTVLWSYDETMFYRKHALTYHQPHLYDSLMIQWWDYVLQEACPYIPQATSLWQPYDPMMRLCFTGSMPLHTTGHISMAALWSYDEAMFYRKHALTYHRPHLYGSHMILWWGYVLQEACPYIPPTSSLWQSYDPMMRLCFTGSMPLHTTGHISMAALWSYDETMFYRKHALTYHRPHLYGSLMILWWGYVLQEAYPYIPLPHLYDSLMILWWDYVLQEACPYIPPTTSLF